MKKAVMMVMSMVLTVGLTWAACSMIHPLVAAENSDEAVATAGEGAEPEAVIESERQSEFGLLAIGVGLAMLGGAIGTGIAQGGIGTAVVAACAEEKKFLGTGLFLLALPETILVIATGIAYLLLQHIK